MSNLSALLKKRQRLEAQIAEAQRTEKRRGEILDLLQKHNLLHLTDEQIIAALTPQPAAAQPLQPTATTTGADDDYQ
ncbi:MAG: hypothetical protein RBR52_11660 [Thiomonas sp.]|uniref:hypothetical protein n=1 Tax=Thiomonas sp. TaxID=2047785 RepID=UPI002A35DD5A|nr:hypothetical protein [Thiomonas sp.]MDY0331134.1 hypothetical protein [Thiomonas sp.]